MKVGIVQMHPVWEHKQENKKIATKHVLRAAKNKCDLVVFPEMTLTGFSMHTHLTSEQFQNSDTVSFFKELAKKNKIAILFGVVFKQRSKKLCRNAAVLVDNNGILKMRYDKIHPFSFGNEHKFFEGGNSLGLFRLNGWRAAVVICYDLRFTGLFAALNKYKPDCIFVIAAWGKKRVSQWNTLLKSRAIETQTYVVASATTGVTGEQEFAGHGGLVKPNGETILDMGIKPGISFQVLDKKVLAEVRAHLTILKDQRPSLYGKL